MNIRNKLLLVILIIGLASSSFAFDISDESVVEPIEISGSWAGEFGANEDFILNISAESLNFDFNDVNEADLTSEIIEYNNDDNYCIVRWTSEGSDNGKYSKIIWEKSGEQIQIVLGGNYDSLEEARNCTPGDAPVVCIKK